MTRVSTVGEGRSALPTIGDVAAGHLSALDRLDGGGGNVHHDVALAEGEGASLQAAEPMR